MGYKMESIKKICDRIIKNQSKRPNSEYKNAILTACSKSKELNYSVTPYEVMFIESLSN